jgi:hypothetical protein
MKNTGLGSLRNESIKSASGLRGFRRVRHQSRPLWLATLGVTTLCTAGALGCTELDPGDDNCVLYDNCSTGSVGGSLTDPGSMDPAWTCLAETPTAPAPIATRPPITYVVPIVDFANPPTRPDGLVITVCQLNDQECANPVPASVTAVPNQPPAVVAITVPYGFEGYFRMTATAYVPTEYIWGGPMLGTPDGSTTVQGIAIPMLRETTMDGLFNDLLRTRDTTAGVLAIRTIGCDGKSAADVDVKMDEPARGFGYTLINNTPVASDPPSPTDSRGVAGYANVSPGTASLRGYVDDTNIGRTAFRVRANYLTVGEVRNDAGFYGR